MRSNTQLQIELIRRNCPDLLRVPNSSLGVSLTASRLVTQGAKLLGRVKRRLGFGLEQVPEDWFSARIPRLVSAVLQTEQALSRPHIEPNTLLSLIESAPNADRRRGTLLGRLAMLEMLLQHHDQHSFGR